MPRPGVTVSRSARLLPAWVLCLAVAACGGSGCPGGKDGGTVQCRLDRDCGAEQQCKDGTCVDKQVCHDDTECNAEQKCDVLSGACVYRNGFGTDCGPQNGDKLCAVGQFCALGRCRDTAAATQCSRKFNCPVGQVCDRQTFYCIEENPCTLADRYPELACDPGDRCVDSIGLCVSDSPPECTPGSTPTGCATDEKCNPAGRCVQCITDTDCGAGLRCNSRAGLCESGNTCRADTDCNAPLVCDRSTALCTVPLPPCTSDLQCQLGQYCDRVAGTCQYKEGKCDDDRFEQNDTPPDARPVQLAEGTATLTELVLCPNDADVFSVELAVGDQLTAVVEGIRAQAHAEVWLLSPDGLHTLRYAEAPPRGNGKVSYVAGAAGTYFVRVISLASKSPYSITFSRTAGTACMPDILEGTGGGNNDPWLATIIAAGQYDLSLCPGDRDWFMLRGSNGGTGLRAGQAISVQLTGPVGEDFDLLLTDVQGATVLASSEGNTSDEFVRYRVAADTDVLIGVVPYGPSAGAYTLNVSVQAVYACMADRFEAYARTGGGPDGGTPDAGLDGGVDASVDAGPDAGLDAGAADAAAPVDAAMPPDAAVVDAAVADASVVDAAVVDAAVADAAVVDAAVADASAVDAAQPPDAGAHDAGVQVPDAGPVLLGNNTRATAIPVDLAGVDEDLSICLGDEDWFAVDAQAHQRVLAEASWAFGEDGVVVEAYGADGAFLARSRGVTLAALSVNGNAAGRVYIRVFSPGAESPYHLSIRVERIESCVADDAEPNNTAQQASPAALAGDGFFTVCGTDHDVFRLEAGAGKRVTVDVDFSTVDGDLDLALLLPDGVTPLAVSDGVTGHEALDVVLPADPADGGLGAYFIDVYAGRSGARAPYHLVTRVMAP